MRNTLRREADATAYVKALLRTSRYHAADALGWLKPLKLRMGLTNRCNSRCIMCNIWKMADNEAPSLVSELNTDEYEILYPRKKKWKILRKSIVNLDGMMSRPYLMIDVIAEEPKNEG